MENRNQDFLFIGYLSEEGHQGWSVFFAESNKHLGTIESQMDIAGNVTSFTAFESVNGWNIGDYKTVLKALQALIKFQNIKVHPYEQ